jgi:hypothetical protein
MYTRKADAKEFENPSRSSPDRHEIRNSDIEPSSRHMIESKKMMSGLTFWISASSHFRPSEGGPGLASRLFCSSPLVPGFPLRKAREWNINNGLVTKGPQGRCNRYGHSGRINSVLCYAQAQLDNAQLRRERLDPLLAGPLGRLQGEPTTKQAIDALFGDHAQSGAEVGNAVRALNGKNPWAARQLVREYIAGVFSSAHKVTGDQFVVARLANVLRANPQTAERLASAINTLPHGASIAPGFQRFLDIMAATGARQRPGSMTSFNTEMMHEMKSNVGGVSGAIAGAGKHVVGAGFKWPAAVSRKSEQWSLGRNLDQLTDLMVNPEAAGVSSSLPTYRSGAARLWPSRPGALPLRARGSGIAASRRIRAATPLYADRTASMIKVMSIDRPMASPVARANRNRGLSGRLPEYPSASSSHTHANSRGALEDEPRDA